jgi:hypothetical protein
MSNSVQIVKDTALNKTQVAEVYNGAHKVYNNQSTPAVLDVNLTGASGSHGLATEATLDSFRTENATNLGALDSSLTDGTAIVKSMGSEDGATTGTQRQVRVDANGRLSVDINSGVAIATIGSAGHGSGAGVIALGLESGNTARAIQTDSNGKQVITWTDTNNVKVEDLSSQLNSGITNDPANSIAVGLRARTDIALASTETFLKCNASGELLTSGGGGGSASTTYNNLAFTILKPTAPATTLQTNSAGIDLTNCSDIGGGGIYFTYQTSLGGDTADISDIVVQYSHDNATWWSEASSGGGASFVPTTNLDGTLTGFSTFFLEVMSFKARWIRLCALHTDNTGIDMATTAHIQLRPF